jgi:hypothetical protein
MALNTKASKPAVMAVPDTLRLLARALISSGSAMSDA